MALKEYFPQLTTEDLTEYLQQYPLSDFDSASQQFQVATGESDVICGVRDLFSASSDGCLVLPRPQREIIGVAAAKKNGKAFTYRYNQPVPGTNTTAVGHASENWMMFRGTSTGFNGTTTFEPQRPVDKAFAAELIAYWLSFVRAGDPNTYKLERSPEWPAYKPANRMRIALQEPADGNLTVSGSNAEEEPPLESRRCAFVASKASHQQA